MVATWTGISELALDDAEAKKLDGAIKRVMKHHEINISQKHADMAYLGYVVATIYGTRAVAIYSNRKIVPQQAAQENGNLFAFPATA